MSIKAYKGFNKDMTCRGFQFKEGETYHEDEAKLCEKGFHACLDPLDCFGYYGPAHSVYHEVELDDVSDERNSDDSKICGKTLKVGATLDIAGIVKAKLDLVLKNAKKENGATGYKGASSATGYKGASLATGDKGASSATGDYGASSATGDKGASSATGYKGASSATGDYGASSATGNCGASSATGYKGASSVDDPCAVAVAWGYHGRAKGVLGSYIVLAEWEGNENNYWTQSEWKLKCAKMHKVDGKTIKPDTWYTLKNGKFVEVSEDNDDE